MIIALSIPVFLLLIFIELAISLRRGRPVYRFSDAVTDIGCGVGSQLVGILLVAVTFGLYVIVYDNCGLIQWGDYGPMGVLSMWALAFVGLDFLYYWWHRWSHEINFLWASHVVHHQSEDYNLAVALRQAWLTGFTSTVVYLPLAILGVPPEIYVISVSLSLLYQFWIHTELVGKLGIFEWVLNSPSHHRVHHGINPQYIDKNHGAILIVWDRLFGTFVDENEPVFYGTVKPLDSFNPIWANLHGWVHLWKLTSASERLSEKLLVLFRPPDWMPPQSRPGEPAYNQLGGRDKYAPRCPGVVRRYVLIQAAWSIPLVMALLLTAESLDIWERVGAVAVLLAGTMAWGGLLEGRRWAHELEVVRLLGSGAAFIWFVYSHAAAVDWALPLATVGAGLCGIFAVWTTLLPRGPGGSQPGDSSTPAS